MKPVIAVFSGHSGGHLFPAVAFSENLRREVPGAVIELVTSRRAKPFTEKLSPGVFDRIVYLAEFPFPGTWPKRFLFVLYHLPRAFAETLLFLFQSKPILCVGFGSYASFPGILLGHFLGIRTLIHEQNLVPGKATAWLARHADQVGVTFSETFKDLPDSKRQVTGLPLREQLLSEAKKFRTPKIPVSSGKPFTVLVVGGSQGARGLNEKILEAMKLLTAEEKREIAVNHITGVRDFERVRDSYRELGILNRTFPFFESMHELYGAANMAITRAGACTIFELALFGLPSLFIPYPHASGHQLANARFFESRGAAWVCEEKLLTPDWLLAKIRQIKDNDSLTAQLENAILKLAPWDAASRLTAMAKGLMTGKES